MLVLFGRACTHLALARPAPRERKGRRREIECLSKCDDIGNESVRELPFNKTLHRVQGFTPLELIQ